MKKLSFTIFFLFMTLSFCAGQPAVRPGVEVLRDNGFEGLVGKKVGLVTNPSGVDSELRSTIDILYDAPGVDLVALYGPEHGVRGDVYAGGKIEDFTDPTTGLPVYSLYGATRKPTPEMLEGVDMDDYEIINLFVGEDVDDDARVAITERLEELYPELEVIVYKGKQAIYDYLIAIE